MPAARRRLAAVPDAPGRAVLYVRVSALMGRGGDDFHSPDLQAAALRRHIASLGLREVGVVDDIDVSGRSFSREGLDRIVVMVEAGQVDAVAVYDLSRLGRNAGEALRFIRFLREHRVSIISTVEKIDDSPEGQFILTQFLALAELYSNQIGRRWAEVIAHRARQGHHHSGVPMGYRRENGELVVDPVIGPAVTEAFAAFAADKPIMEIAKMMTRVRGKRTAIPTVKRVLHNPTYLGKVVIWGIGRHRLPNWSDTPAYIGPGRHERLVDDETWETCRERHKRDSRTPPRRRVPSNPLAGILACGHCERPMQLHTSREYTRDVPRLKCGGMVTTGDCKGPGRPPLEATVDAILDKVREYIKLLRSDRTAQAAAAGKTARAGADVARLKRELADTREAMAKLATGWAMKKVPDAAYEVAMKPLEAAERELDDRLRDASVSSEQPAPAAVANLAERLLATWPKMTVPEKNRALKQVVKWAKVRRSERYREPVADRITVDFW
jgi:site-specific DNA recombinase